MLIYLIQHGQSERNATRSGPLDCSLTEIGIAQAEAAALWFQSKAIETIYCSPAVRTLQTASIVARHLRLRPVAWPELVEWGFLFDSPGLTRDQAQTLFPSITFDERFPRESGWASHKETETWPELAERAESCLDLLVSTHSFQSGPILLVTHKHFIRFFIATTLSFQETHGLAGIIHHYNCGISCLEIRPNRRRLMFCNAHGHMSDALIT